jgi:hypothetical protein
VETKKGIFEGKIKERTLHGVSGAVGSLFCKEFAAYGAMCGQSTHIAAFAEMTVLQGVAAHCAPFDNGTRQ